LSIQAIDGSLWHNMTKARLSRPAGVFGPARPLASCGCGAQGPFV
jgi:hypothetical protein